MSSAGLAFVGRVLIDDNDVSFLPLSSLEVEAPDEFMSKIVGGGVFQKQLAHCDDPPVLQTNVNMSSRCRSTKSIVNRDEMRIPHVGLNVRPGNHHKLRIPMDEVTTL